MRAFHAMMIASLCAAAWPWPTFAQTAAPQAEPGVTVEDCRVEPAPESGDDQAPAALDSDLSATLDKCNGVLQPPATGDADIAEPPPASGETPVIPPGALPEQPPAQGGSEPT